MASRSARGNKAGFQLLTVSEAASVLHVHPNTVRTWTNQGMLKAYRMGRRGDRRFRMEDVLGLLCPVNHELSPQMVKT